MGKDWTVMIYFNADSEEFLKSLKTHYNVFARHGSTDRVNFVAAVDMPQKEGQDNAGPVIHYIKPNISLARSKPVYVFKENNLARQPALKEFLRNCKSLYPARHYMLIFWDHGSLLSLDAYNDGVGESLVESSSYFRRRYLPYHLRNKKYAGTGAKDLYMISVSRSIATVFPTGIDIVAFDACDQQMLETAIFLQHNTRHIIAAQGLISFEGMSYGGLSDLLHRKPFIQPAELANQFTRLTFKAYVASENKLSATCLSSINTLHVAAAFGAMEELAGLLLEDLKQSESRYYMLVEYARLMILEFNDNAYYNTSLVDLVCFLKLLIYQAKLVLKKTDDPAPYKLLVDRCKSLQTAVKRMIDQNFVSRNLKFDETISQRQFGAHGLSVFFPMDLSYLPWFNFYFSSNHFNRPFQQVNLNTAAKWPQFLLAYHQLRMRKSWQGYKWDKKALKNEMKKWLQEG